MKRTESFTMTKNKNKTKIVFPVARGLNARSCGWLNGKKKKKEKKKDTQYVETSRVIEKKNYVCYSALAVVIGMIWTKQMKF